MTDDERVILTTAREKAAALLVSLERDRMSLARRPGQSGLKEIAAVVDATRNTLDNLNRLLGTE